MAVIKTKPSCYILMPFPQNPLLKYSIESKPWILFCLRKHILKYVFILATAYYNSFYDQNPPSIPTQDKTPIFTHLLVQSSLAHSSRNIPYSQHFTRIVPLFTMTSSRHTPGPAAREGSSWPGRSPNNSHRTLLFTQNSPLWLSN